MKEIEDEVVETGEKLKIFFETKITKKQDKYNKTSFEAFRKDNPDKNKKLKEASLEYMGENDFKSL